MTPRLNRRPAAAFTTPMAAALPLLAILALTGACASALEDPPWTAIPCAPVDEAGARASIAAWYRLAAADLLPRHCEAPLSSGCCQALATPDGIAILDPSSGEAWLIADRRISRLAMEPTEGTAPDETQLAAAAAVTRGFLPLEPPLDPTALEVELDGARGWRMRLRGQRDFISVGAEGITRCMSSCCGGGRARLVEPRGPGGSG